jgi:hypothetical protein
MGGEYQDSGKHTKPASGALHARFTGRPQKRYFSRHTSPSVETTVQKPEPAAKRLSDAKIARALGITPQAFCLWRKAGCPNSSIEAVQTWRMVTPYKKRDPKSQARPGNKNTAGKKFLEQKVEKWGLNPPQKLGRKLSPELIERVARCFSDGFSVEETALLCDLNEHTVKRWKELAPIKKSVLARKQSLIQCITDRSLRDWVRYAWLLERKYPTEYSRPEVAHAIATASVTQNNLTQNLVISSDVAAELTRRSRETAKKVRQLFENRVMQSANQPQALPNRDNQDEDARE